MLALFLVLGTVLSVTTTTQLTSAETDGTEGRPNPGEGDDNRDQDNPAAQIPEDSPGSFLKDNDNEKGGGCNGSGLSDEFGDTSQNANRNSEGKCDNND
jgi:hypothetical protein